MQTYLVNPLALKALSYLSAGPDRWIISGVLCEFFPNGVRYVATDGRALAVVTDATGPISADDKPEVALTLDGNVVARIVKQWRASKHPSFGVTIGEETGPDEARLVPLWFDGADTSALPSYVQPVYRYPNWRQVVPRRSWVSCVSSLCSIDSAYAAQVGAFFRTITDAKDKRLLAECTFHGVSPTTGSDRPTWLATTARRLAGRLTAYAIVMGVAVAEDAAASILSDPSLPFPA